MGIDIFDPSCREFCFWSFYDLGFTLFFEKISKKIDFSVNFWDFTGGKIPYQSVASWICSLEFLVIFNFYFSLWDSHSEKRRGPLIQVKNLSGHIP
jgi:hypothetical protein